MSFSPYQYYNAVPLADGARVVFPGVFTDFRILDISGGTYVMVKFQDSGEQIFEEGMAGKFAFQMEQVELRNDSGAPITVTFTTSMGTIVDDRRSAASSVSISAGDTILQAEVDITALAAASCKVPARATRKNVLITNTGTQKLYIVIASTTGTAPAGMPLDIGATISLDSSADIFFYKDTGVTGQKIHYLETYD